MKQIFASFFAVLFGAFLAQAADDHITYEGKEGPGKGKHIVLLSGDEEYRSEEGLPMLAKILSQRHGFKCTVLFSLNDKGEIDPTNQKSLSHPQALDSADAIIMLLRFRTWPDEVYKHFDDACNRGIPVIGLRTASHAIQNWLEMDKLVLGGNYQGHHKNELHGNAAVVPGAKGHPVLNGLGSEFKMGGSLYKNTPLAKQAKPLLTGRVEGHPAEPVAWTHSYKGNRTFYTSLGHKDDFANPQFVKLLDNAVTWCLAKSAKPGASPADVADKYGIEEGKPFRIGVSLFEKMWKTDNLTLLDVRTTPEYKAGHIPGTKWIDWFSPKFADEVAKLDKNKVYLVYCAGGVRSARACKKMSEMGFKYTVDLAPGFNGWKAAGKAIEK